MWSQQWHDCPYIRICTTGKNSTELRVSDITKLNKTGTFKVGAISKAQKAQKTFKKNLKFLIFFSENVA